MINVNNLNNIYINKMLAEIETLFLEEGQVLLGEIREIHQKEAIIHFEKLGMVRAGLEGDQKLKVGDTINFLVKSIGTSQVHLKPLPKTAGEILNSEENLTTGKNQDKDNGYLIKLLKDYGIKADKDSIEYVKTLIKYNIPLNEEKIVAGLQVIEKLDQLLGQLGKKDTPSQTFINIKEDGNLEKNDIRNILVETKVGKEVEVVSNLGGKIPAIKEAELERSRRFTNILEDFYLQIKQGDLSNKDIEKIVALLSKYNLKFSLNNIKNFFEFKENIQTFYKDFVFHENINLYEFTNMNKNIIINSDSLKEIMENNYLEYRKLILRLEEIKDRQLLGSKDMPRENLEKLQDKLEFLNELNQELNYVFIPLILDDHIHRAFIRLLKDRKATGNPKANISILINLDTKNLGSIMVSCQLIRNTININFHGLNKNDIPMFKGGEEQLLEYINYTGYKVGEVNYIHEDKLDILDILIVNQNPIYQLNIGV